jgi:hypothetical protein
LGGGVVLAKSLLFLSTITLLLWAALAYPVSLWLGEGTMLMSAVAVAVCLVPAILSLCWFHWANKGKPEDQLLAMFGGMGIRMLIVVALGMVLYHTVEALHYQRFWLFIIFFYLLTLTLEVTLVVRERGPQPLTGELK